MFDQIPMLSLIVFSPLIGILLLAFIKSDNGKWLRIVGIATTVIPFGLTIALYSMFDKSAKGMQFLEQFTWFRIPLNLDSFLLLQEQVPPEKTLLTFNLMYSLGIDGFSLPLILLTTFVVVMAALASIHIKSRWKTFYILFLILEIGILGVFMAQDLLLFFIFFELTLIPMFFLIGIWGYQNKERAANRFLIYNGLGSAVMLFAFLILISTAGFTAIQLELEGVNLAYSASMETIAANLTNANSMANSEGIFIFNSFLSEGMKTALFVMLLVAFGIKLPIFPFHTWMLKVHSEAPPSVVMIHSGILLKMGAYGLLRFGVLFFPEQAKSWAFVLAILGAINIIYGAINAYQQRDFKLVLAYSSISHMGIILIGLAAFNEIGFQGLIIQLISHGLISALMFLLVGTIYERTNSTYIDQLGGLAKTIPFISAVLLFAGMALLGLPSLSGFVGELLAFMALFEKYPVITLIGTLGIILAAVYVLRGVMGITFGPLKNEELQGKRDAVMIEAIPMIAIVSVIILIGVYPSVITDMTETTVKMFIDQILVMGG